jgi:hypothetical protein
MSPPPRHNSKLANLIRDIVKYELDARIKPFKNGESWQVYLFRTFTLERIGLAILLIYNLGGGVHEAKVAIQSAAVGATEARARAEAASIKADIAADKIQEVQKQLEVAVIELQKQAAMGTDTRDRMGMTVTRTEFNSTIKQQILPRLDRIEKSQRP